MSSRYTPRPRPGDDRSAEETLERLRRQVENTRASDIPIDAITGLDNADGSPASNLQEALEALVRTLP